MQIAHYDRSDNRPPTYQIHGLEAVTRVGDARIEIQVTDGDGNITAMQFGSSTLPWRYVRDLYMRAEGLQASALDALQQLASLEPQPCEDCDGTGYPAGPRGWVDSCARCDGYGDTVEEMLTPDHVTAARLAIKFLRAEE